MSDRATTGSETSPIRVAWISSAFGYAGDLVYFQDIFAQFADRFPAGFIPVDRSFPADRYPYLPLRRMMKFRVIGSTRRSVGEITYLGLRRLPTVGSMIRLARSKPEVLILIEFSPTALAGFALAKLAAVRTVVLIESDPAFRGAPTGRVSTFIKRLVVKKADSILVSNRIGAEFVLKHLRAPAERVLVGPYLTSSPPRSRLESAIAVPTVASQAGSTTRILFVNSLTARKGIIELISALATMDDTLRASWTLDVVGMGSDWEHIQAHVRSAGLEDNVVFHGRVPYSELGTYYSSSDLIVCPSLADYRSLSGFEAVNAGKPAMISIHDGAHQELIEFAPGTVSIDPRDIGQFSEELRAFIADEDHRSRLAAAARDIPHRFTLDAVGANVQRAVELALARRSGRRQVTPR